MHTQFSAHTVLTVVCSVWLASTCAHMRRVVLLAALSQTYGMHSHRQMAAGLADVSFPLAELDDAHPSVT